MARLSKDVMMQDRDADFYQRLRARIRTWQAAGAAGRHRWAEYILAAPDLFHLMCKLSTDSDVPTAAKAKLAVVIAYFVLPFDFMPEAFIGPVGYVDDVALTAFALNQLLNTVDSAIIRRHWAGEGNVLALIQKIVRAADRMVGSGLWARLRGRIPG